MGPHPSSPPRWSRPSSLLMFIDLLLLVRRLETREGRPATCDCCTFQIAIVPITCSDCLPCRVTVFSVHCRLLL
ncbi:hypothetical protein BS78_05G279600 [Paspalum vaginatum]|nr:hypothetical protein BS78_05G279600 [Paspalum vaginatum]